MKHQYDSCNRVTHFPASEFHESDSSDSLMIVQCKYKRRNERVAYIYYIIVIYYASELFTVHYNNNTVNCDNAIYPVSNVAINLLVI